MTTASPRHPLDDDHLERCLWALPKAEMHFHFEGAFRWTTIRELHPQGADLPASQPWLEMTRPFADFADFRRLFRDYIRPVTGTPGAIERHAFEVIEDLALQNVRYVEIIIHQWIHTEGGLTSNEVWRAIARGRDRAMTRYAIDARLVLGLRRGKPPELAMAMLEEAYAFSAERSWLAGIDLGGDERQGINREFAEVYRRGSDLGLKLRAHAGESCDASNVRDAVFVCGVTDVSHGVRAAEDVCLMRELAQAGVFLHVCPTSNLLLEVVRSYDCHPLRTLCNAGVRCTVNSDDPLFLGTDITGEYRVLIREMRYTLEDVGAFIKTAFHASLLSNRKQMLLCAEVDSLLDRV